MRALPREALGNSSDINSLKQKDMVYKLNSVGCSIDSKTKMVYPLLKNGRSDKKCGVSLDDCEDDWFNSLSDYDLGTVDSILNKI